MAWRNQQNSNPSTEGYNRFDKFFKKNTKNEDENKEVKVTNFVNKRYDRNITFENTEVKQENYNNERRPNNYNNERRPNNYNNERRSNNYNDERRPNNYNDQRRRNYNNYKNDRNSQRQYNSESIEKKSYYSVDHEISDVEKALSSEKYISQKKKDELNEKLSKLKEDKKNEFPELKGNTTQTHVVNSVWGNMSNKVKSIKGVTEANNTVRRLALEKKHLEKVHQKKEIYEEHVESDFEGDDFIDDDDKDGWYDEEDL